MSEDVVISHTTESRHIISIEGDGADERREYVIFTDEDGVTIEDGIYSVTIPHIILEEVALALGDIMEVQGE